MNPRRQWGPWRMRRASLVLDLPARPGVYEIDLTTCTTSAQVLDWIIQVSTKTWITTEILANLVIALDSILMLQASLCGNGESHELDQRQVRDLINGFLQLTQAPGGRADD